MTRDRKGSRTTIAIRAARDLGDTNSLVTTTLTDNSREAALEGSQQVRTMGPLLPMEEDNNRVETLVDSSQEVTLVDNSLAHLAQDLVDSSRMETLVANRLVKTMALLDQTSVANIREKTLVASSREVTLVDNSREVTLEASSRITTLMDNRLETTMAHQDQTSVDSSQAATLVASSREITLVDNSREVTLVDNRLERTMAPLDQTSVDSSQAATLVDSNKEARVSPSLAPKEATDSQPRECSQARTMEPQTLDHRTSQLPLILS